MIPADKKEWMRLAFGENIGPVGFRHLIGFYGSAAEAVRHVNQLAAAGGRKKPIRLPADAEVERQFQAADACGAEIVCAYEPKYPQVLRALSDAPPVLFVKGDIDALNLPAVAIVGTRNASLNGKNIARHFAKELAGKGYAVVSGLAKGIDAAAHAGALEAGGKTIAVLGSAVDDIYPPENKDLYTQIAEKGCIVSELTFGSPLNPKNFPRRNRIISGLAQGVLVIEAQEKSGSLITARCAADQGREVFAVPGSPVDPRSQGPNKLIKDGATLVSHINDITDVLEQAPDFRLTEPQDAAAYRPAPPDDADMTAAHDVVLSNLGADIVSVDELIRACDLPAQLVQIVLVELELAGRLERYHGGRVSLIMTLEDI
ncbi:MAG: DNA-processing protein DprA [Alphaproteobacteria bacterium]|nr:DNA-processing protein DprA [Alphaproteobacteria bacterium]